MSMEALVSLATSHSTGLTVGLRGREGRRGDIFKYDILREEEVTFGYNI